MIRLIPLLLFLVAACGPTDSDPGPGGVTVEDARALDEAAAKIDEENLPARGKTDSESR